MMFNTITPASKIAAYNGGYYVMGKKAKKTEYNVALALEYYKIDYLFQVYFWGGRSFLGGVVLDFLIFNPFPIPLEVYGDYWHSGEFGARDRLRLSQIEQMFGRKAIIIWGSECDTYEHALTAVKRRLML